MMRRKHTERDARKALRSVGERLRKRERERNESFVFGGEIKYHFSDLIVFHC